MTNTDLELAIKDAIVKNLPQQVGEALAARLKLLETLELYKIDAEDRLNTRNTKIRTLESTIASLKEELGKCTSLQAREDSLIRKELEFEARTLEVKLAAAEKISESYLGFVSALTKNPVLKKTFNKSITTGIDYNNAESSRYKIGETTSVTEEAL